MSARTVPRAVTRAQAIEWDQKRYLGEPCLHGHVGWRYVRDDHCCDCLLIRIRRMRGTALDAERREPPALIASPKSSPAPSPSYVPINADFIAPVPLARLMAGR